MKKTTYDSPAVRYISIDLEGFICESIEKVSFTVEADEYQNMGEEDIFI